MARFDLFCVFAEMRTGSNFLEANLNAIPGLACRGEAFNPHFIGYPKDDTLEGMTARERDGDPARLLEKLRGAEGLNGFRYFSGHDARVFDMVVPDARCAKIVLTRNPLDSYISWKIARATGQWKMTNMTHRKEVAVAFDAGEFETHVETIQAAQVRLMQALQRSGQTAFYVAYEDLQDVDVMNGLAAWLGVEGRLEGLDKKLKKQNPSSVMEKVSNPGEMEAALSRHDRFNLHLTPNFEPRRGPGVPSWVASTGAPLLYMPIRSGPGEAVERWLSRLGGLRGDFNQNSLRQWMRANVPHRSFTVLRHPVARAHAAYCERILSVGKGSFPKLRRTLRNRYDLPLTDDPGDAAYDHRAGFLAFARFLKGNLSGQSAIRVDAAWASQAQLLQDMAQFAVPDMIAREEHLARDMVALAAQVGIDAPAMDGPTDPHEDRLSAIYDAEIEAAVAEAYARDYEAFGFGPWRG